MLSDNFSENIDIMSEKALSLTSPHLTRLLNI